MLKRLKIKFVAINMIISTVLLCLVFSLILYLTGVNLRSESDQTMLEIASSRFSTSMEINTRTPYLVMQLSPGGMISASATDQFKTMPQETMQALLEEVLSRDETSGEIAEMGLRFYRLSSPLAETVVFTDGTVERNTLRELGKNCAIVGAAAFLVLFGVSILLARWAVKPVEKAWRQQRQFVADASHELKTPLTVITTNAELLQSPDCPEEQRQQFTDSILTMSRQMRGLTESLLNLARMDNGSTRTRLSPVELSRLTADAALPFEALFYEQQLNLHCLIEEGITVRGDEMQLRQLIEIFLDNARKYAAPRTDAYLALRRTDRSHCILSMTNLGEPISAEDLPHLFERFYRADKARAMNQSFGLGLSIAKEIADGHKAQIWADSQNGVNSFCVMLQTA